MGSGTGCTRTTTRGPHQIKRVAERGVRGDGGNPRSTSLSIWSESRFPTSIIKRKLYPTWISIGDYLSGDGLHAGPVHGAVRDTATVGWLAQLAGNAAGTGAEDRAAAQIYIGQDQRDFVPMALRGQRDWRGVGTALSTARLLLEVFYAYTVRRERPGRPIRSSADARQVNAENP